MTPQTLTPEEFERLPEAELVELCTPPRAELAAPKRSAPHARPPVAIRSCAGPRLNERGRGSKYPNGALAVLDTLVDLHARHTELLATADTPRAVAAAFVPIHIVRCLLDDRRRLLAPRDMRRRLLSEAEAVRSWGRRSSPREQAVIIELVERLGAVAQQIPQRARGRPATPESTLVNVIVPLLREGLSARGLADKAQQLLEPGTKPKNGSNLRSRTSPGVRVITSVVMALAGTRGLALSEARIKQAVRDFRKSVAGTSPKP